MTQVDAFLPNADYSCAMLGIGARIDETGTLLRNGDGFALRRDSGGRYELDLHRAPVVDVQGRVRIVGTLVADGLVDVDLISAV